MEVIEVMEVMEVMEVTEIKGDKKKKTVRKPICTEKIIISITSISSISLIANPTHGERT